MKKIDYNELRKDLEDFALGAYFGGKEHYAIMYHEKIQKANNEELIKIAKECNFPLEAYEIDDYKRRI